MERNSLRLLEELVAKWDRHCDADRALRRRERDRETRLELATYLSAVSACIRDLKQCIEQIKQEEQRGNDRPG